MRTKAQRRPLTELVDQVFRCHNYFGFAGGLPGGRHRQANLLEFQNLTRRFSRFRKQGLHRFLRFVDELVTSDNALSVAPVAGEGDDVVRILSIHQSKGLEFPIVFVGSTSKSNPVNPE